jgi:lipid-A-disaccharide synthase-like uncharacterized protein
MSTIGSLCPVVGKTTFLGFEIGFWGILGFAAQGFFFSRFLFQWLASERRGHSYVPVYFWWISLGGGALMLAYAIGIEELPLILGQSVGLFVYARNLVMIYRKRRLERAAAIEPGDFLYVHPDRDPADKPPDHAIRRG